MTPRLSVAVVLAVLVWGGSEAVALASPQTLGTAQTGPSLTTCQPAVAQAILAGQNVALTLSQAQQCWPNAQVSASGSMPGPGEYIVPHGGGWAHAGVAVTFGSGRDALAYSCGQQIWRNILVWEQYLTYIALNTGNSAYYCNYAWNNWETPTCSGGGSCQPPSYGVIGNRTYTENPWYNQLVLYGPFVSDTFYCRIYYSANDSWSSWCD